MTGETFWQISWTGKPKNPPREARFVHDCAIGIYGACFHTPVRAKAGLEIGAEAGEMSDLEGFLLFFGPLMYSRELCFLTGWRLMTVGASLIFSP